jgi:hypothetical protein
MVDLINFLVKPSFFKGGLKKIHVKQSIKMLNSNVKWYENLTKDNYIEDSPESVLYFIKGE